MILIINALITLINLVVYRNMKNNISHLILLDSICYFFIIITHIASITLPDFVAQSKFILIIMTFFIHTVFIIHNILYKFCYICHSKSMIINNDQYLLYDLLGSISLSLFNIILTYSIQSYHLSLFILTNIIYKIILLICLYALKYNIYNAKKFIYMNLLDTCALILYVCYSIALVLYNLIIPSMKYIILLAYNDQMKFISGAALMTIFHVFLIFMYFSCSIPWSYIIMKSIFNINLFTAGSGNPGTTNAKRALSNNGYNAKYILIITTICGLFDIFRAYIPLFIILKYKMIDVIYHYIVLDIQAFNVLNRTILPYIGIIKFILYCSLVGIGMVGNMWTPWLNFRGGLGAACMFGMIMAFTTSNLKWFIISTTGPILWLILSKIMHKFSTSFINIDKEHIVININLNKIGISIQHIPLYLGSMVTVISGLTSIIIIYIKARLNFDYKIELFASIFAFICVILRHDLKKGFVDLNKLAEMHRYPLKIEDLATKEDNYKTESDD